MVMTAGLLAAVACFGQGLALQTQLLDCFGQGLALQTQLLDCFGQGHALQTQLLDCSSLLVWLDLTVALLGSDKPAVQGIATAFLANFANVSQQNKDGIIAAGAVPPFVALLTSNQCSVGIGQCCSWLSAWPGCHHGSRCCASTYG